VTERIFIDCGGFKGHSSLAALDPIFAFDKVYCFEPDPDMARQIRAISDPRLVVFQCALADRTGHTDLFGGGDLGASIIASYPPVAGKAGREVAVYDAGALLVSIVPSDAFVRMKFNCEGAEVAIIGSVIAKKAHRFLDASLIDFDAERIDALKAQVVSCKSDLDALGIRYFEPPEVQYGMVTNYGGVRNYLIVSGAAKSTRPFKRLRSLIYNLRMFLNPEVNGYHKMLILKRFPILHGLRRTK